MVFPPLSVFYVPQNSVNDIPFFRPATATLSLLRNQSCATEGQRT